MKKYALVYGTQIYPLHGIDFNGINESSINIGLRDGTYCFHSLRDRDNFGRLAYFPRDDSFWLNLITSEHQIIINHNKKDKISVLHPGTAGNNPIRIDEGDKIYLVRHFMFEHCPPLGLAKDRPSKIDLFKSQLAKKLIVVR